MIPRRQFCLLLAWAALNACGVPAEPVPTPVAVAPTSEFSSAPPDGRAPLPPRRWVEIGPDGYFVLNGKRTVVYGIEDEHHRYTRPELDALVPRLKQLGVNFLVLYPSSAQDDFFYERLEAEGLYVAQELGNTKKRVASPFANTGGVLGTVPDEATIAANLAHIDAEVGRLSRFRNILFWWMGGEYAEPDFHTPEAAVAVRASIARYADAVHAKDPFRRPFTVSHQHVEALLARAYELNHRRPVFYGGWFAQAPLLGPGATGSQAEPLREKWRVLSTVPSVGASAYHLSEWGGNGIPHALFEWRDGDWWPTPAGDALRGILAAAPR